MGLRARTSKDYDTAFRQAIERVTDVLAEAETHVHGNFRVTPGKAVPIGPTGAVRIPLKLGYGTHDWASVDLEVAAAEGKSGSTETIEYVDGSPQLSVFGLPDVERVALLPLSYQIAQKLHACTEARDGKENDRFRDLVDLILLDQLVVEKSLPGVRDACVEVFSLTGTHAWPPKVRVYPLWPDQYRALTESMGFPVTDVADAAAAVEAMISRISKAPCVPECLEGTTPARGRRRCPSAESQPMSQSVSVPCCARPRLSARSRASRSSRSIFAVQPYAASTAASRRSCA